jgi:hypothetical protein
MANQIKDEIWHGELRSVAVAFAVIDQACWFGSQASNSSLVSEELALGSPDQQTDECATND